MKKLFFALASFCIAASSYAQPTNPIPLWPNGAPGALGKADKDIPTLTAYLPKAELASGAAMVICPGGGYGGLAAHEGEAYAMFLRDNGIAGFVLKYRLGSAGYRHPVMLQDVSRALRLVRANASEWKLDSKRIGVMGSSAGGHLASTLLTHFDSGKTDADDVIERQSSRPDLGILCYPVITMGETTHSGSKKNLLGENPSPELIKELSNELQVTKETPPCFIFHTVEDKGVLVENALMFASALRKADVPFDLHIYEKGPHGMGLGFRVYSPYEPSELHPWTKDCLFFLKQHEFLKEANDLNSKIGRYIYRAENFKIHLVIEPDGTYETRYDDSKSPTRKEAGVWHILEEDLLLEPRGKQEKPEVRRLRADRQVAGRLLWVIPIDTSEGGAITYPYFEKEK